MPATATPPLPFRRSYCIRPGQLLAGCYPGDKLPAARDAKLNGLLDAGVTFVLSLMEADERDHAGRRFEPYEPRLRELALGRRREITFVRRAIRDLSVPTPEEMRETLDLLDAAIARGETAYVHCWGGRGRTGTVLGCHLVRHGLAPEGDVLRVLAELTSHVPEAIGRVPETREQREFVNAWRCGE